MSIPLPAPLGALPVLLAAGQVASPVAAVDRALPSGFIGWRLELRDLVFSNTSADVGLRVSTNGGSSFNAGATDYKTSTGDMRASGAGETFDENYIYLGS